VFIRSRKRLQIYSSESRREDEFAVVHLDHRWEEDMCTLCDIRRRQALFRSRRNFLKGAAASGVAAAAGLKLFAPRPAAAQLASQADMPQGSGGTDRRYVIRGGAVMSMDPNVGDFPQADVLVQGKTILDV